MLVGVCCEPTTFCVITLFMKGAIYYSKLVRPINSCIVPSPASSRWPRSSCPSLRSRRWCGLQCASPCATARARPHEEAHEDAEDKRLWAAQTVNWQQLPGGGRGGGWGAYTNTESRRVMGTDRAADPPGEARPTLTTTWRPMGRLAVPLRGSRLFLLSSLVGIFFYYGGVDGLAAITAPQQSIRGIRRAQNFVGCGQRSSAHAFRSASSTSRSAAREEIN